METKSVCSRTSAVWYLGRCLHLSRDQYLRGDHLPENWLDDSEFFKDLIKQSQPCMNQFNNQFEANAGIAEAVLILLLSVVLVLVPVLSAVGICERCQIQSGGVYFLVSHILGGQIGAAVGVIYTLGQVSFPQNFLTTMALMNRL